MATQNSVPFLNQGGSGLGNEDDKDHGLLSDFCLLKDLIFLIWLPSAPHRAHSAVAHQNTEIGDLLPQSSGISASLGVERKASETEQAIKRRMI